MKQVRAWLNNDQYKRLLRQCEELDESEYCFVKTSIEERMAKNEGLLRKAQKWLLDDHKL